MTSKSTGVTETERLLAEFCERSFLKLWSYPNPFKDDGHELCDLLPDGSAIAKAIDYSLNHWEALSRFLLDGEVPIDNNHLESRHAIMLS